ncbi:MAG TPA: hypothetical protein PK781_01520 [Terrimesophilobacter sp.]|nr:hypothetical protein [Terrimesophilobacter sp.]
MTQGRSSRTFAEYGDRGDWQRRLGRMAFAIEAWRKRAEAPQAPESGSSLAADALDGLNVESLSWYSMCVSSEHLEFAIDAMRATSTLYPTAYMTVARTAFVAAVNAVWVLAPPSRQMRRERALRLRADDLRAQLTSFRDMVLPDGKPDQARAQLLARLRQRQVQLQAVASKLDVPEDVGKMRFNQTEAIDWVAQHMHDEQILVGATQSIWRSGSAAAHAQYHFALMRLDRNEAASNGDGSSLMKLRGDLENDVGPALAAGTLTLSEAFRLYDLRRTNHRGA